MSSAVASAVISGALSAGSTIGSQLISNFNSKKQFYRTRQLIAEQNEYNTPSAVMQRYADAGINPMFAVSETPFGLQTDAGSAESPQTTSFALAQAYAQARQLDMQDRALDIQAYDAESRRIEADAASKNAETNSNVGTSIIQLNNERSASEEVNRLFLHSKIDLNEANKLLSEKSYERLTSLIQLEQLEAVAKSLDIQFTLETWDTAKKDLVMTVALKAAERANLLNEDGTVNRARLEQEYKIWREQVTSIHDENEDFRRLTASEGSANRAVLHEGNKDRLKGNIISSGLALLGAGAVAGASVFRTISLSAARAFPMFTTTGTFDYSPGFIDSSSNYY